MAISLSILVFVSLASIGGSRGQSQGQEPQLRAYCKGQQLGSVCDADVNRMCQHPQLISICRRQRGGEGTTPVGGGAASTTPTPRNQTRPSKRPRHRHTTRVTSAPVTEKGQPPVTEKGHTAIGKKFVLSPEQVATIQGNCAKKAGGCQAQSPAAQESKKHVSSSIAKSLVKSGKAKTQQEAEQKAAEIIDAVNDAKKALYDTQGLSGIEPDDDGLWHKDMQLNLEQAQFLINEVTGVNGAPTAIPRQVKGGRDKRFAVFMESFPTSKWNLPIGYALGSDLTADQASQVREAIAEIQRKTCIKFYEDTNTPPRSPYILYTPYYSSSFCGQSPVGNQGGVNNIWLNFNCDGGNIKATIIHETMHSLGVHHEHIRVDRDDWITMDWNNVDPQSYDLFDGRPYVNSYTTYGVPYDYYSVMHYHAFVATMTAGQPNMIPKYFPDVLTKKIGQRVGMSDRDAEKLRKIYCENDCTDYHVWCGYWATENYCLDSQYFAYMKSTCGKSCGFCPNGANT